MRIPARGRHITQEPQVIADHLLGADLATFRRRLLAFLVDLVLFGLIFGALFVGLTAWGFHRQDPTIFTDIGHALGMHEADPTPDEILDTSLDVMTLIRERCPDAFPPRVDEVIRNRDRTQLKLIMKGDRTTVGFGSGKTHLDEHNDGTNTMVLGTDLLLGEFSTVFGWGGCFIGWFTLWTLATRGRTPGKFMFRIRIVRLDGKRLTLWDCFSRAAGYSASAATLMLGFLEAIWHPNRQAIHDKIAGTVVTRR